MTKSESIQVMGLGAPIVDQVVRVSEEFLETIQGEKGGSQVIQYSEMVDILNRSGAGSATTLPGGSAANTIVGLAALGTKCSLLGMIGDDQMGEHYEERLKKKNIHPLLSRHVTQPTAQVICLITPDGQRTMRSFLGASDHLDGSHVTSDMFEGISLLHCEGYAFYNGNGSLLLEAMKFAKEVGAQISLDLASFEIVRKYRSLVDTLLSEYVDIVFCNEDEAQELYPGSPAIACGKLAGKCKVAVVTMGAKGCLVQSGSTQFHCPTVPMECIDATGAGDIFASGFLHNYLKGNNLKDCCRLGHSLGASILGVVGAQLPEEKWSSLQISEMC